LLIFFSQRKLVYYSMPYIIISRLYFEENMRCFNQKLKIYSYLLILTIFMLMIGPGCSLPLHRAIIDDKIPQAKFLIVKDREDIDKFRKGKNALILAVEKGQMDTAGLLLEAGADVNAGNNDGYTALIAAVSAGQLKMVELLLKYNADVNLKNIKQQSPLYHALETENYDLATILIDQGAEPSIVRDSPDGIFISARMYQLIAHRFEKLHKLDRAIDLYSQAVELFETANKKYLQSAQTYGSKPEKAKKSNLADFVDKLLAAAASIFAETDWSTDNGTEVDERIRQIEEKRGDFKKLAEESRISALECQNILNFIREQRKIKK